MLACLKIEYLYLSCLLIVYAILFADGGSMPQSQKCDCVMQRERGRNFVGNSLNQVWDKRKIRIDIFIFPAPYPKDSKII